jgi:hypothetical protein
VEEEEEALQVEHLGQAEEEVAAGHKHLLLQLPVEQVIL